MAESKDISAAERYTKALEEAGGDVAIKRYASLSRDLERMVKENHEMAKREGIPLVTQSLEYQLLDIDQLYNEATQIEECIQDFAKEISRMTKGTYHPAKIKSKDRALFKTQIKYGGDVSRLMDIQRCTVEFPDIETMYEGISMLKNKNYFSLEHRVSARIISFEDRFQQGSRLSNGYCDIQLLLMVDEHVSEMQMNVTPMLRAKHMGGHRAYRLTREKNERLLMACIRNEFQTDTFVVKKETYDGAIPNFEGVGACRLLKEYGADPNAVRDKTGRSCLHYAARHGNISMIEALLEKKADSFCLDRSFCTPLHRALMHRHAKAAFVLLQKMNQEIHEEKERTACLKKVDNTDEEKEEKEKKRTLSESDQKFLDEYNKKKKFLERALAGQDLGRIASLGSRAKARLKYLLQWFQERESYFLEKKKQATTFCKGIESLLCTVIDYIEETIPTMKSELHMSVHNVIGVNMSLLREEKKFGNFFVRAIVPGCAVQQTDIHWDCNTEMAEFNWRLKFRIVLNLHSKCWGTIKGKTLVRLQLLDRVNNVDTVVSESVLDIRELLCDAYLMHGGSSAPTRGLYEGILGDPDRSRWICMRNLSLEEQKASINGVFPSIDKTTVMDPRLVGQGECPVFGTFTRLSCKLIPDSDAESIRIGAHHQGFGRGPPNTSPHLEAPDRVKKIVDKELSQRKRTSFVSTPYFSECRVNFADLTKESTRPKSTKRIDLSNIHVPMPVEIRLVIWKIKGLDKLAKRVGADNIPATFLAAHIGSKAMIQKTDIAWSTARHGEAEFNWRMNFPVDVSGHLDKEDVQFKLVLDAVPILNTNNSSNEMRFWSMALQPAGIIESMRVEAGITCPLLSQIKSFGTCTLDLKKRLKNMRIEFDKMKKKSGGFDTPMQPVEVFQDQIEPALGESRNARWVSLGHKDSPQDSCEALISISLVPHDYASNWPQGQGRAIPNDSPYLPPPKRVRTNEEDDEEESEKHDNVPVLMDAPPGVNRDE